MNQTVVVYHANCTDGFFSAYEMYRHFGENADYIPAFYNRPMPDLSPYTDVYMIDISFSRDEMVALNDEKSKFVFLDHHATAEENLKGLEFGVFNANLCGTTLAWKYMNSSEEGKLSKETPPLLYQYVQDRDLWTKELPFIEEMTIAIDSYPKELEVWAGLEAKYGLGHELVSKLVSDGEVLLRSKLVQMDQIVQQQGKMRIQGFTVPCVNAQLYMSDVGHMLNREQPFSVVYFLTADGKVKLSFRSSPQGEDVRKIAESFGGGGHKHAAGSMVSLEEFQKMLL